MIVHTGEALIDFIPTEDTSGNAAYVPVPGGSPYNTAVATARLEVPNSFFGRISTDFFGDQLVSHLRENGVGDTYILRDSRLSTLAFVKRTDSGEARYAFFAEDAADRAVTADDLPVLPEEVQAIQFGSISIIPDPVGGSILSLVRRESARRVISFDPNIRESLIRDAGAYRSRVEASLQASTIVKISDEDLEWVTGSAGSTDDLDGAARDILDRGPHLVVVTAGAQGATAFTRSHKVFVPARKVAVADTVGAGDSFHGGVLAWLYHNGRLTIEALKDLDAESLRRMLQFAGAVSAGTCSRPGNDPPRLKELTDISVR
jgi:fructokinase